MDLQIKEAESKRQKHFSFVQRCSIQLTRKDNAVKLCGEDTQIPKTSNTIWLRFKHVIEVNIKPFSLKVAIPQSYNSFCTLNVVLLTNNQTFRYYDSEVNK